MMKRLSIIAFLLQVFLFTSVLTYGQTDTATIVGTVVDASGAAIPNAAVNIVNLGTGLKTATKTNSEGNYVVTALKIGNYSVAVELTGFKGVTHTGIVLNVQDRLRVDFTLQVGAVNEQVMVTGAPPLLQTESSALGDVVGGKQMEDLPLNGRDYTQLAALTTGVVKVTESGNGVTGGTETATNGNAGGAFAVNGTRGLLNNFLLDGIDNNSNDNGGNVLKTNVDAIAEFKVQTSNYSAEFGRSGGAVINATIKNGTNQFHGDVFEFLRNSTFDAKDFFELPTDKKAPFRQNQFGFTFGGPVLHDRLFFFTDYQGTRIGLSIPDYSKVPTQAEIGGDFSALLPDVQLYDPATTTVVGGVVTRQPFAGNIIDSSHWDTIAHNLLSLYPAPNFSDPNTSNNYFQNDPGSLNTDQGDARLDYVINPKQQIFVRFSASHNTRFQQSPLPGLADGGGNTGDSFDDTRGLAIAHTWTLSSTMVNDVRAGLSFDNYVNNAPHYGLHYPPADLLVPGVPNDPNLNGITLFQPTGGFRRLGTPGFDPTDGRNYEIQYGDTLSIVRGKHALKVGVQLRRSAFNLMQLGSPRGRMRFDGQFTSADGNSGGSPIADWLLGIPYRSNISLGGTFHNRQNTYGGFAQDDFKLNSKLTLNLGLRYDYTTPIYDSHNQMANLDFATNQLVLAGKNGASRGLVFTDKDDFAPRIGLAWQVVPRTVIRAGYGRFFAYQETRTGDPFQLYYNPPFVFEPNYITDGVTQILQVSTGFPPVDPNNITGASITTSAEGADTHLHAPVLDEWNFNVQRELPGNLLVEVAYVGSKSTHLQSQLDLNQDPVPGPGDIQSRRPHPQFGSFTNLLNRGNSTYNGLQFKVEKRAGHGLTFLSAFTFSKSINDQPEICCSQPVPQNSYDLRGERGSSDFDQKVRWVTSFDYQLPLGKGQPFLNSGRATDLILGGWHVGGIIAFHTGFYFTSQVGFDPSNTGTYGMTRAKQLCDGNLPRGQRNVNNWFNTACYVDPDPYTFGNSGKNGLVGPGATTSDMSLRKVFNITERTNAEFRFELFNAINHPAFAQPDPFEDDGPGSFGVITSTVVPNRQMQFGLKLNF